VAGKSLKICLKGALICSEALAIVLFLFLVAGGILLWRISSEPVDIGFAKDYIEQALNNSSDEYQIAIDKVTLSWPDLTSRLFLDLKGVSLSQTGADDSASLTIDEIHLSVSRRYLLIGQIRPVSVKIDEPSLQLQRKDNQIDLFFQDQEILNDDEDTQPAQEESQSLANIFNQLSEPFYNEKGFLSAFRSLEIENAKVVVRDYELGVSWYLTNLDFSLEEAQDDLKLSMGMQLQGGQSESAGLGLDMVYDPDSETFDLSAYVRDVSPSVISKFLPENLDFIGDQDIAFSGEMTATLNEHFIPQTGTFNLTGDNGEIFIPEEYEAPISVEDIAVSANYDAAEKKLNVTEATGVFGGIKVAASAELTVQENAVQGPVSVSVPDMPLELVPPLFPKSEMEGEAAKWLVRRMSNGRFYDVQATFDLNLTGQAKERSPEAMGPFLPMQKDWSFSALAPRLDFKFEGVTVQYSDTLMPVTEAVGSGYYEDDAIVINGDKAMVKDVTGTNAVVKVTGVNVVGGGKADINFDIAGPLSTALEYASDDPIEIGDTLGFSPDSVGGTINMNVQLNFPTVEDLPKEEVRVKLDGKLNNVKIPNVVKGLELTGGPLDLRSEKGAFFIKGDAQLAGRDISLDWTQYFEAAGNPFEMQVKAQIGADLELRHHFGVDLDEWMSGTLPIDLVYTDPGDNTAMLDVTGNLNPVQIDIEPFDYQKVPGVAGEVTLKAFLRDEVMQEITDLNLKTRNFSLNNARLIFEGADSELRRGNIESAVLGRTAMNVDFEITPGNLLKVIAKGPVLDASSFIKPGGENGAAAVQEDDDNEPAQPMHISATAAKMYTGEDLSISQTKLYIETDTDGDITQLEMDAKAGQGDVYLRFKPEAASGKRTFRLESSDAGALLKAFDLYENMSGGSLLIYGEPREGDVYGNLYGTAQIENFSVVRAPALAQLIGAMSLVGVEQLLNNDGLKFSKLEADFEWRFRRPGNLLVINDGRTSGSSLGLTFKGTVNQATNITDVSGTIVPLSGVNTMIGSIPLIGDLLTGGSGGGLIAATYTMKGPSDNPRVSVNPLSVLAPGFLRKILFEGGYENPIPPDEQNTRTAN